MTKQLLASVFFMLLGIASAQATFSSFDVYEAYEKWTCARTLDGSPVEISYIHPEMLSAYLEGELEPSERARLEKLQAQVREQNLALFLVVAVPARKQTLDFSPLHRTFSLNASGRGELGVPPLEEHSFGLSDVLRGPGGERENSNPAYGLLVFERPDDGLSSFTILEFRPFINSRLRTEYCGFGPDGTFDETRFRNPEAEPHRLAFDGIAEQLLAFLLEAAVSAALKLP